MSRPGSSSKNNYNIDYTITPKTSEKFTNKSVDKNNVKNNFGSKTPSSHNNISSIGAYIYREKNIKDVGKEKEEIKKSISRPLSISNTYRKTNDKLDEKYLINDKENSYKNYFNNQSRDLTENLNRFLNNNINNQQRTPNNLAVSFDNKYIKYDRVDEKIKDNEKYRYGNLGGYSYKLGHNNSSSDVTFKNK